MTIVLSIAQAVVTPRTITRTFSVPAGTLQLKATLTRVGWPAGDVGSMAITMPDGSAGPQATFAGGVALARDGTAATESWFMLAIFDASQKPVPLPVGSYGITVVVQQTVTTAVTVERF